MLGLMPFSISDNLLRQQSAQFELFWVCVGVCYHDPVVLLCVYSFEFSVCVGFSFQHSLEGISSFDGA